PVISPERRPKLMRHDHHPQPSRCRAWLALALLLTAAGGVRAGETMTIEGRIDDPDGKPLPGVQVAAKAFKYRRSMKPDGTWFGDCLAPTVGVLLGMPRTDEQGRFRITAPAYDPADPYTYAGLWALAPGYGFIQVSLDHAARRQEVHHRLSPERVARGRL